MNRKRAMAMRCQLITGSYEGSTRSCECVSPRSCSLTSTERELLCNDPKVVEAKIRNEQEYHRNK